MDTAAIIAIVIGAVVVLGIVVWRFNAVNIRGKFGDSEASIEASQHPPAPTATRPGTGAVSIGGSARNAKMETSVDGATDGGAGAISVGGDLEGGSATTRVRQARDAD